MRLATFNVMHGRSPSDGLVDLRRLRETVAAMGADVLGLQEVDRGQPRSDGHDLTAEAAAAMGGEGRFAPAMMGTPDEGWRPAGDGDTAPSDEPAYGIALISRLPVRRWAMARLPSVPVRAPVLLTGPTRRVIWLPDEPRVLLAAVLDTPGGLLTVATTHLSFVPGWNGTQLRLAVRALRSLPAPRILLGDLNLPGPLPRSLTGWRRLGALPTYPADRPRVQLDHVLAHGRRPPRVVAARAPAAPISDHRPLIVDLTEVNGRAF
ncbi:MAG TPA: endonuclease/exonuclease/phosphatase family protein [Streptosporangiaceae bacterium]|nr:endonuclease/exonuclease/phosphatase family protein [Streptosporangiaceae bacterium]